MISAKMRSSFFNADSIVRTMDAKQRIAFIRFGKFCRKVAQRRMRKGGRPSLPGNPPKVREGQLKKLIFFSWDEKTQTVIVGPDSLPSGHAKQTTPNLIEYGGTFRDGKKTKKYDARPYMRPAFATTIERLGQFYK